MLSFSLLPVLGLKTNVPPDDPTLLKPVSEGVAASHAVDGKNFRVNDERGSTTKAPGKLVWSNSATASTTNCLGMFELNDGTNRTHWVFMGDNSSNGRVFRYDGSRDPIRISDDADHSGAVEWASGNLDKYSIIRVGDYMVFSDHGETTPYCSDYNDTTLSKLVSADTEYKGKYLEKFQRRVLLANINSSQISTGGEYSVIWTGANPTPASSCTFGSGDPPTNHLYTPTEDPITGIKVFARNHCFVYGENSINRIDYYPNYTTPFAMVNMVDGEGATNHHSIVAYGGRHFLFNEHYGFVEYRGGAEFPHGGRPISEDIEDVVASIARTYYGHIIGCAIPHKNLIAWTVPLYGNSSPSHVLYYHLIDRTWAIEEKVAWWLDNWVTDTDVTWTDLLNQGFTYWDEIENLRWSDIVSENPYVMLSNTDGHAYTNEGNTDNGSDYDGYRVEPVLDLGRPNDKELLLEIWFGLVSRGSYNMYCHYRGGDTVSECVGSSWTVLDELSCNDPANAVVRLAKVNRFHQIRYGTDAESEDFGVNRIEFKFVPQGRY